MNQGKRFSLVYLNRCEPVKDNQRFRNRLAAFYNTKLSKHKNHIIDILRSEAGIEIPYISNYGSSLDSFFKENEIREILDAITLVHQALKLKGLQQLAKQWGDFVSRCLDEENVGYRLDDDCGVHYFIDEEFAHNHSSTLAVLNSPEMQGVKAAYEDAYRHMDNTPPDTKASARSIFESLEILVKQLVDTNNLNKSVIENKLKSIAIDTLAKDKTEKKVIGMMFDGFGTWVNGMHNYRHGQAEQEPVAPSEELLVYMLSSGSSFLRLLIEIKNKI